MFINDDGMQLISEKERKDRMEFYADHNIGWVARPGDGHNGFKRRGKFKKVGIVLFHPALKIEFPSILTNICILINGIIRRQI